MSLLLTLWSCKIFEKLLIYAAMKNFQFLSNLMQYFTNIQMFSFFSCFFLVLIVFLLLLNSIIFVIFNPHQRRLITSPTKCNGQTKTSHDQIKISTANHSNSESYEAACRSFAVLREYTF